MVDNEDIELVSTGYNAFVADPTRTATRICQKALPGLGGREGFCLPMAWGR